MASRSVAITSATGRVMLISPNCPGFTSGKISISAEKLRSFPVSITTSSMAGIPAGFKSCWVTASEKLCCITSPDTSWRIPAPKRRRTSRTGTLPGLKPLIRAWAAACLIFSSTLPSICSEGTVMRNFRSSFETVSTVTCMTATHPNSCVRPQPPLVELKRNTI